MINNLVSILAVTVVCGALSACTMSSRNTGTLSAAVAPANAPADDDARKIERGRYIANSIVDCNHCHTKRSTSDFTHAEGPEWAGGEIFGEGWHLPGVFVTPNLTPDNETGLGLWTEAQIKNAIRNGVNQDGERLFPLMPSHFFQSMSDADLDALVAYLRTLPPKRKPIDQKTVMQIPRSALPPLAPVSNVAEPASDPVSRGKYIVTLANCITCHSPTKGGQIIPDRFLAGGVLFRTPFGEFVTPNITPDAATGIGAYSDEEFVRLFRTGVKRDGNQLLLNFMPWWIYRNLTDEDLKAVIAYLRSLPPVVNEVHAKENQYPLGQ